MCSGWSRLVRAARPGGLLFIPIPNTEQRSWFKEVFSTRGTTEDARYRALLLLAVVLSVIGEMLITPCWENGLCVQG